MIIYYSIILWFLLMWFCYSASAAGRVHGKLSLEQQVGRVSWGFVIITFAYLTFWVGMRTAFVDTAAYIRMFEMHDIEHKSLIAILYESEKGYGFTFLTHLFKNVCPYSQCWLMFLALLSCGCVMVTFKKYSPHFFLTSLIYILSCSFAWSMNGIRQYFCVTIIFACLPLIIKKRWILLTIVTFLLSTVHTSALIMLPVYFVVQSKPWSKMMIISILTTSSFVCFPGLFSSGMEAVLDGSDYEGLTERFGSGVNIIRVLFFSLPAVIAFLGRKKLSEQNNNVLDLCVNMSVLTACMYAIGSVTSGILMGRFPIYCQLFSYILIAYESKILFSRNSRILFVAAYIVLFSIFFKIQTAGFYYQSELTGRIY